MSTDYFGDQPPPDNQSEGRPPETPPEDPGDPGDPGDQGDQVPPVITAGDAGGDPAPPAQFPVDQDQDLGWYRCPSCGRRTPAAPAPTGAIVEKDVPEADRQVQQQHGPCPDCLPMASHEQV